MIVLTSKNPEFLNLHLLYIFYMLRFCFDINLAIDMQSDNKASKKKKNEKWKCKAL